MTLRNKIMNSTLAGLAALASCKTPTATPEPLVLPALYDLVATNTNATKVEKNGTTTYSLSLTGKNNYVIAIAASTDKDGRKLLQTTMTQPNGWGFTYRDGGAWGGLDNKVDYVTTVVPGIDEKRHPSVQIDATVNQLYSDLTARIAKALQATSPVATIDLGDLTVR